MQERAEKRQKLEEERQHKEEEKKKKDIERQEKVKAKEQEKQEKERQKEAERLERERQKENERLKKEEERKKREEVKEQERLKKEEELAKRAEEKKKKDDERLKKEDEKRKQLEEKEKERQKQKEKEEKQASVFSKFFHKSPATIKKVKTLSVGQTSSSSSKLRFPSGSSVDTESDKENSNDVTSPEKDRIKTEVIEAIDDNADIQIVLIRKPECAKFSPMPFQIKSNMAVAPLIRRAPLSETERDYLQVLMQTPQMTSDENQEEAEGDGTQPPPQQLNKWRLNFIERVKRKEIRQTGRTTILDDQEDEGKDADVTIVMADVIRPSEGYARYRMKLLQFDENRRPAYWGTWKKKSLNIKPTNPWTKEKV
jgi:chromatin assembly factor 1 subunit A